MNVMQQLADDLDEHGVGIVDLGYLVAPGRSKDTGRTYLAKAIKLAGVANSGVATHVAAVADRGLVIGHPRVPGDRGPCHGKSCDILERTLYDLEQTVHDLSGPWKRRR